MSRFCRQVFDCGDGVREVTALAVAALKIPNLAADTSAPAQSGDSEDSVAAVQDARAPTRLALGSWPRCAILKWWRLPMNLSVLPASFRQKRLGSANETSAAPCRGAHFCAPIPPTAMLSDSAQDGAHPASVALMPSADTNPALLRRVDGVTRPTQL